MTRISASRLGLLCLLVLVAGCGEPIRQPFSSRPAPVLAKPQAKPMPAPPRPPSQAKASSAQGALSAPALALLEQAGEQADQGDRDGAIATLERAIRIQPKNPRLWHRMAELRLYQDKPLLAIDLAKKSLSLAQGDKKIVQGNWALIAEAKKRMGDPAGAAEALRHVDSP
ncbi:MAG TPA: tetratricopeptide repeat protein [Methylococcaceae bacterium]|nr:tetratricopeptide repeat protein [Methylococcaceae bacterium]